MCREFSNQEEAREERGVYARLPGTTPELKEDASKGLWILQVRTEDDDRAFQLESDGYKPCKSWNDADQPDAS